MVSNIAVGGTDLVVTGANGGFNGSVDLEPLVDAAAGNNGYLLAEVDGDITNEIQALSILGNDLTLSNGGGTVTIPSAGADGVVSNITTSGTDLAVTGVGGGFNGNVDLEPLVDAAAGNNGYLLAEIDGDVSNELQTLSILGNDLTLSDGGGTVTLPSGGADGVVSNIAVGGTDLVVTGANGGFNGSVDLEPLVDAAAGNNGYLLAEVDVDTTNEIQTLSILGNDLSLSNGGGTVTIPSAGADGVVSNISTSGTNLTVTGVGGGFNGNVDLESLVDAAAGNNGYLLAEVDGDVSNELQTLSILGNDLTLSNGGGTVTLPSGGADGVVSNITTSGTNLVVTGANGGFNGSVDLESAVDAAAGNNGYLLAEVDGDVSNEIQTLSILGNDLTLSNGGGTVTLPGGGTVSVDATLTGDGSGGNPLGVATGGITAVQLAEGSVSGGPTGVIATNSITQGDIGDNAIGAIEIQMDAVGTSELANDAVTTAEILNGTILDVDINGSANIAGTKINADFGAQDVITGGNFISGGITLDVPDYVFEHYYKGHSGIDKEYKFQSLKQVEEFIKEHHHLPGIKSFEEAQEDGFWNLSMSNLQNLEKIEELFLHTIEQEKKIKALEDENEQLAEELDVLKSQILEIKTLLNK